MKFGTLRPDTAGNMTVIFSHTLNANEEVEVIPPRLEATRMWVKVLEESVVHTPLNSLPKLRSKWSPHFLTAFLSSRKPSTSAAQRDPLNSDRAFHDIGDLPDMALVLSAANIPDSEVDKFATKNRTGSPNQSPWPASAQSGATLLALLKKPVFPEDQLPPLMANALVKSTRLEHHRMLKTLSGIPDDLTHLPLPIAIVTHLYTLSKRKAWASTTLFKYLCTAQGALKILPLYRLDTPPIILSKDPNWTMAVKGARHLAVEHIPDQPPAATVDQVTRALSHATGTFKAHVRIIIMVGWLTAARLGCVRQLKSEDFSFKPESKQMDITFRRGKGVRARKSHYTVTTLIPASAWWAEITAFVKSKPGFLFPKKFPDTHLTKPLRFAGLEQRSIRRGSLQAMAALKTSPAVLMNFSGHISETTLNRYLDFGKKRADLASLSLEAAKALWKEQLATDEWWDITPDPLRF